jgi:ketosteroid isomerase-like protein
MSTGCSRRSRSIGTCSRDALRYSAAVSTPDAAAALEQTIERYNAAWNDHDVDAIIDLHAPGMVFANHTAGETVEGDAVRDHIARIFENWPDLSFRGRRLYARDGLVVSEWTATATASDGRRLEWDGVDIFPFRGGKILRKDVYSSSHAPRVLAG